MTSLQWTRTGADFLDAGAYRVLRCKMVSEDRSAYFRYVGFFGKDPICYEDSGADAKSACEQHFKSAE